MLYWKGRCLRSLRCDCNKWTFLLVVLDALVRSKFVAPVLGVELIQKPGVEMLTIPDYVFEAFGLPATGRNFNYSDMLFRDGKFVNHWPGNGPDASVPDLTQQEAQLWFFYAGTSWIKQGIEALHCGQIMLMSSEDTGMVHTHALFSKLRAFAAKVRCMLTQSLLLSR
jgi:hypothetical protein